MEGHAEMDMSVTDGPLLRRMVSPRGLPAISHSFVMDWAAIWPDIAGFARPRRGQLPPHAPGLAVRGAGSCRSAT